LIEHGGNGNENLDSSQLMNESTPQEIISQLIKNSSSSSSSNPNSHHQSKIWNLIEEALDDMSLEMRKVTFSFVFFSLIFR